MASPMLCFALLSSHFSDRMNDISETAMLKSKFFVPRTLHTATTDEIRSCFQRDQKDIMSTRDFGEDLRRPKTYVPSKTSDGCMYNRQEERLRGSLVFVNSTVNLSVASLLATVPCNTTTTDPACRKEPHRRQESEAHRSHGKLFASVCKKLLH